MACRSFIMERRLLDSGIASPITDRTIVRTKDRAIGRAVANPNAVLRSVVNSSTITSDHQVRTCKLVGPVSSILPARHESSEEGGNPTVCSCGAS